MKGEIQFTSMLTGLFWDVEHFTFYKPPHERIRNDPEMIIANDNALQNLKEYGLAFEKALLKSKS